MSTLATHLNSVRTQIFKHPQGKKYAEIVEEKTKVNAEYFVVAAGLIIAGLLFNGLGAKFISNVIGFTYPVYASLRAIETEDKNDDTQWLVYWVVFAAFCLIENFIGFIQYWISFYYPLKVSFLLWCMIPTYNGANVVYQNVIKPAFDKHGSAIDEALNSFSSKIPSNKKNTAAAAVPSRPASTKAAAVAVPVAAPVPVPAAEVDSTEPDTESSEVAN